MNLFLAKSMLMNDRLDWRRPHLRWLPEKFYFMSHRRHTGR